MNPENDNLDQLNRLGKPEDAEPSNEEEDVGDENEPVLQSANSKHQIVASNGGGPGGVALTN